MRLFPPRGGAHLGGSRRGMSPFPVVMTAILFLTITGCSAATDSAAGAGTGSETPVLVQPVLPTPTGTGPAREPARQLIAVPDVGSVTIEPGAFTDRLLITRAGLQQGPRPTVTAELSNAVDVSEMIVLEVRADFYDATGGYLGSGHATYADEEHADTGATPLTHGTGQHDDSFTITVPSDNPLPAAVSAILTVPQLVNE